MRVPLKWLSEYVDLTLDPAELAARLTIAGAEVSDVITSGGGWEGVAVGRGVEGARHPNADRLVLATVDVGGGQDTLVCGGPHRAPRQEGAARPAAAPVGSRPPPRGAGEGGPPGQILGVKGQVNILGEPLQRYSHRPFSELAQEAQVVGVEEADVLDAVAQHGDTLDPHAESEAGVLL